MVKPKIGCREAKRPSDGLGMNRLIIVEHVRGNTKKSNSSTEYDYGENKTIGQ